MRHDLMKRCAPLSSFLFCAAIGLVGCDDAKPAPTTDGGAVDLADAVPVSASKSELSVDPPTVLANSLAVATVRIVARDSAGNPLSFRRVELGATGEGNVLTQPVLLTDSDGVTTGTIRSSIVGDKIISATIDDRAIDATTTARFVASLATRLTWATQPTSVIAGQVLSPAPTIRIEDIVGNLVTTSINPITITFGTNAAGGTLTGTTTVAAVGGIATFSDLSIDRAAAGYTLSVSAAGFAAAPSLPFTVSPGSPSATMSTFTLSQPSNIIADGVDETLVTVTVRDAIGNLLSGIPVLLSSSGSLNTFVQPGLTATDGTAQGRWRSSRAEEKQLTVRAKALPLANMPMVTFIHGPVSEARSQVACMPSSAAADGIETITIAVTVFDALDNPIPDAMVSIVSTGSGNVISMPALTDSSGDTSATFSSTVAEMKQLTVTIDGSIVLSTQPVVSFN